MDLVRFRRGHRAGPAVDGAHPACTDHGVAFTNQTGLTVDIAAGGSTETTLADTVSMDVGATDPCQGAVFTFAVTLSGIQV